MVHSAIAACDAWPTVQAHVLDAIERAVSRAMQGQALSEEDNEGEEPDHRPD